MVPPTKFFNGVKLSRLSFYKILNWLINDHVSIFILRPCGQKSFYVLFPKFCYINLSYADETRALLKKYLGSQLDLQTFKISEMFAAFPEFSRKVERKIYFTFPI